MEAGFHRLGELFAQLGLPGDDAAVGRFIGLHAPLAGTIRLEDAPFWAPAQARLLREELLEDADWAPVVDQLDAALRAR